MKFIDIPKTDKTALYFKESLSNLFNIYNKEGINSFNINRTFVIDISDEIKHNYFFVHNAVEGEFLTNISYKYYGTIRYWWLICKINNIIDPTVPLTAGQTINVLDKQYIDEVISLIQNG